MQISHIGYTYTSLKEIYCPLKNICLFSSLLWRDFARRLYLVKALEHSGNVLLFRSLRIKILLMTHLFTTNYPTYYWNFVILFFLPNPQLLVLFKYFFHLFEFPFLLKYFEEMPIQPNSLPSIFLDFIWSIIRAFLRPII